MTPLSLWNVLVASSKFCLKLHFVWYQNSHCSSLLVAVYIMYRFFPFTFNLIVSLNIFLLLCLQNFFSPKLEEYFLKFALTISDFWLKCFNHSFFVNLFTCCYCYNGLHLPFYLFLYISYFLLYSSTIIALSDYFIL